MQRKFKKSITLMMCSMMIAAAFSFTMTEKVNAGISSQTWIKYETNPILDIGPLGSWDDKQCTYTVVIKDGATYKMWYTGDDEIHYRICYATSSDGISWIKYPDPVLDVGSSGSWDGGSLGASTIIKDEGFYKMWYFALGSSWKIGYATSTDGIVWVKYLNNPVLNSSPSGSWDDYEVAYPWVIKDGSVYKMWYSGRQGGGQPYRIGYATSSDGVNWIKYAGNPVMDIGSTGAWDDFAVADFSIIIESGLYKMWYSGHDGINFRIGYATSSDGLIWTKCTENPVLDLGSPGSWERYHVGYPSVLFDEGKYKMWYVGANGTNARIGYATYVSYAQTIIDIDPDTLNLKSKGKWITCYIELLDGYDVRDIDPGTILLENTLSPELDPKYGFVKSESSYIMDNDGDGILERMVKFDRSEFEDSVGNPNELLELTVTGKLTDGTQFEGSDTIRIIEPP